jgi:hypothetical protein
MAKTATTRARFSKLCLAMPEAVEEVIGQHSAFSVRGKKFAYFLVDHHGADRVSIQCKAGPGENEALVNAREVVTEAYLLSAPKRLIAHVRPLAR